MSLCSSIINPRWNYCEQFCQFNFRAFKTASNKLRMHRLLCKIKLHNSLLPCMCVQAYGLFIYFRFPYLFLFFGCGGSSLLHTRFLQLQRVGPLFVVVRRPLSRCRVQALAVQTSIVAALGSAVMAHGLSCIMACGTFPDQGPNLCPLHCMVAC